MATDSTPSRIRSSDRTSVDSIPDRSVDRRPVDTAGPAPVVDAGRRLP